MKYTALFVVLLTLHGCRAIENVGLEYAQWRTEQRNERNESQYRKAVASHAGQGDLIGTWTQAYELRHGKNITNIEQGVLTLSLFRDETYIKRHTRIDYGTHTAVSTGKWTKEGPGSIRLIPHGQTEPTTIVLENWTNTFVQADAWLHDIAEQPQTP